MNQNQELMEELLDKGETFFLVGDAPLSKFQIPIFSKTISWQEVPETLDDARAVVNHFGYPLEGVLAYHFSETKIFIGAFVQTPILSIARSIAHKLHHQTYFFTLQDHYTFNLFPQTVQSTMISVDLPKLHLN